LLTGQMNSATIFLLAAHQSKLRHEIITLQCKIALLLSP
jgi:hypothetical protein